jgi:multicomponent Na+:H+ antiporter subunit B
MIMLAVGVAALAAVFAVAIAGLPDFGGDLHPYRDHAVAATFRQVTANAVSSVNYDQRAFDTFGEETILVASVAGVAGLLRPVRAEERRPTGSGGRVLDSTRLLAAVFFPMTVLIGLDVVAHGAITPGGGFQGGVIIATGIHLLYVGGRYRLLERLRPLPVFEWGEAAGLVIVIAIGVSGLAIAGSLFNNFLPKGQLASLLSSGTVPLLSCAVGLAVVSSIVVLLAGFLDQALAIVEKKQAQEQGTDSAEAAR